MNVSWPKLIKRSRPSKGRPKKYIPKSEFRKALANPRASGTDWLEFNGDVLLNPELSEKSLSASVYELSPNSNGMIIPYLIMRYDPRPHAPIYTHHLNWDLHILSGVGEDFDVWKASVKWFPGHSLVI